MNCVFATVSEPILTTPTTTSWLVQLTSVSSTIVTARRASLLLTTRDLAATNAISRPVVHCRKRRGPMSRCLRPRSTARPPKCSRRLSQNRLHGRALRCSRSARQGSHTISDRRSTCRKPTRGMPTPLSVYPRLCRSQATCSYALPGGADRHDRIRTSSRAVAPHRMLCCKGWKQGEISHGSRDKSADVCRAHVVGWVELSRRHTKCLTGASGENTNEITARNAIALVETSVLRS